MVSWARLLSLKLLLDLRMNLRAKEIAFKFHAEIQIMAGSIKVFLVLFLVFECNTLKRGLFE